MDIITKQLLNHVNIKVGEMLYDYAVIKDGKLYHRHAIRVKSGYIAEVRVWALKKKVVHYGKEM